MLTSPSDTLSFALCREHVYPLDRSAQSISPSLSECLPVLLTVFSLVWFSVDHNTLWRSPVTSSALHTSLSYYSAYVSAPPVVFGVWIATVVLAVVSLGWKCVKGWKDGKGAFLFDAAGLCESRDEAELTSSHTTKPQPNRRWLSYGQQVADL